MRSYLIRVIRSFDIHIEDDNGDFLVEELTESRQFASDCLATGSSASTIACACTMSTAGSFGCVGSVISCGG